jgi:hypothetical protein
MQVMERWLQSGAMQHIIAGCGAPTDGKQQHGSSPAQANFHRQQARAAVKAATKLTAEMLAMAHAGMALLSWEADEQGRRLTCSLFKAHSTQKDPLPAQPVSIGATRAPAPLVVSTAQAVSALSTHTLHNISFKTAHLSGLCSLAQHHDLTVPMVGTLSRQSSPHRSILPWLPASIMCFISEPFLVTHSLGKISVAPFGVPVKHVSALLPHKHASPTSDC